MLDNIGMCYGVGAPPGKVTINGKSIKNTAAQAKEKAYNDALKLLRITCGIESGAVLALKATSWEIEGIMNTTNSLIIRDLAKYAKMLYDFSFNYYEGNWQWIKDKERLKVLDAKKASIYKMYTQAYRKVFMWVGKEDFKNRNSSDFCTCYALTVEKRIKSEYTKAKSNNYMSSTVHNNYIRLIEVLESKEKYSKHIDAVLKNSESDFFFLQ